MPLKRIFVKGQGKRTFAKKGRTDHFPEKSRGDFCKELQSWNISERLKITDWMELPQ